MRDNAIDILIVRHGKTPDNCKEAERFIDHLGRRRLSRGLVISGHNEVQLTQEGVRQSREGGRALTTYLRSLGYESYLQFDRYSSDLPRAAQTEVAFAQGMGVQFAYQTGPPVLSAALRERGAGRWQGVLRAEALEQDPSIAQAFDDVHYRYAGEGGESLSDAGTRAGRFVAGAARPRRAMIVYAHEITNIGMLAYLQHGEVAETAWEIRGQVDNAGFFHVRFNIDTQRGWVVYHS